MPRICPKANLWHNEEFIRLLVSNTVSQFGNTFTQFALPVLAVLVLDSTPLQLGTLSAVGFLPYPTIGLFAGVWVDRHVKRRTMVACHLGRAVALSSIPLSFLLGAFSFAQLFAVALANGILSVFFDAAYQAYLPSLVERKDLAEGNQKLQMSNSGAQIAGPSVAGFVYQALGGGLTVALDVFSYLVSSILLTLIAEHEQTRELGGAHLDLSFFGEVKEGVHIIIDNPILRRIIGCTATSNFGTSMVGAVFTIFVLNYLHFSPFALGLVGTSGAVGFIVGAVLSIRFTKRFGVGRSLAVSISAGFVTLATPLGQYGYAYIVLSTIAFVIGVFYPIYNINAVTLRQAVAPDRLQGRVNATARSIVWGTVPAGSIVGGVMGVTIGVVNTIYFGAFVSGIATVWILLGPVVKLKTHPESPIV